VTTHDELQSWLVEHGFPPTGYDAVVDNRTTPLMKASHLGNTAMVKMLLGVGAKHDARNSDGNNALWLACVSANLEVMGTLIETGIDIDNRNDNDATCLMYASSTGKAPVLARLLQAGANLQHETLDGFSALDMASTLDCLNLLRRAARQNKAATGEAA